MAEMALVLIASQLKIIEENFPAFETKRSVMIDGTAAKRTNRGIDKIEQTGKYGIQKNTKGPLPAGSPFYDDLF